MEAHTFNPEVKLEHTDRAQMAQTVASPGYIHINRIMRSELDIFIIDLINTPEDNEALAIARFKLSKAAAMYYQRIVNRINMEVQQYVQAQDGPTEPVDMTEGNIDLGALPSTFDDIQLDEQLLEEGSYNEF